MDKLAKLLAATLVILSCSANYASAFDATPPSVESCTISPRVVSDVTGGNIRVTIKVKSSNGLSSNVLSVLNMKNNSSNTLRQLGGFIMSRESGDEFSGTWVQDIAVKPGLMPGIYELSIFPLEDKVQNRTSFLACPGQDVSYGVVAPTPTPTPRATPIASPKPSPLATASLAPNTQNESVAVIANLQSQLALLRAQMMALDSKLKKICSLKPKPKGC